jgi:protein TonB
MPVAIPSEVARIVEEPIASDSGVIGGVPGLPGHTSGSILGGILSANTIASPPPVVVPPPPPPPPPQAALAAPAEPVRVGGVVKEPRVVKLVPPIYPKMASLARVGGTVVLEAVVTVDGTVAEIRIVSGHPLLVDAAIAAVKQWQYEPTLLNGVPTAVILIAKVHFERAIT